MDKEIDFLQNNGACRVRAHIGPPATFGDNNTNDQADEMDGDKVDLSCEDATHNWSPKDTQQSKYLGVWPYRPERFIDGKDVGRTVSWLRSPQGYPVPVRLSQIGAVVMRNEKGSLRREFAVVERVVSMAVDFFPWNEIEAFAIALKEHGFRLLICQPLQNGWSFDFERMRQATQNRSLDEMTRLEKQALALANNIPTLVDGRLRPRSGAFNHESSPVIGMIKTLRNIQLHPKGWQVFYDLKPGERTPAFIIHEDRISVLTWYLRITGGNNELPNWGVIRLEIPLKFFENELNGDWRHIDQYSQLVCDYRCRDQAYSRAPVSIHPVQRAEESLGAIFSNSDRLINHFYHLTGL